MTDPDDMCRAAAYREFRQLALSQVERGPTRQDIRQAVADILKSIDTNPAAFWERDQSSGTFRS